MPPTLSTSQSICPRNSVTQGKNLEAGTEAEAMEACCLQLAPHGLLSLLSYTTQDSQPRSGTVQSKLGPPTAVKEMYHKLAHNLVGTFPQTSSLFPND